MPQIEAIQKFPFGKRVVNPGEIIEVTDKQARLWKGLKRAIDYSAAPKIVDLPEEVMVRASKREPITEIEPETVDAIEPEAVEDEAPKPKRAYRRRDMTAEYGLTGAFKPSES